VAIYVNRPSAQAQAGRFDVHKSFPLLFMLRTVGSQLARFAAQLGTVKA
jgi:hypothetical protein